jgi:hypothetical protein
MTSQDIGGRYVASTVVSNIGASAVARVIPFMPATRLHYADWRKTFWLCEFAFLRLALALLFVDSTRSLRNS